MNKRLYQLIILVFSFCNPLFAQEELDTVSTFDMEKMSRAINSSYHEGGPVISSTGDLIYFFRTNHPRNRYGDKETQDIWYSKMDARGNWSEALNAGNTLNRYLSNQVFAIVDDGNTLLISGGNTKNGVGLSMCSKLGEDWTKPIELDIPDFSKLNKGRYYGATMSNDKSVIIYYFSETEGSLNSDLYISTKVSDYAYTKPEKLGLSTPNDDLSPYICNDNKTLYYSSAQKGGYGSVDIWEVKRLDDSWKNWSKPVNMEKPLNSNGFDAYFTTEASFKNAFTTRAHMSSDGGSLDIWHFTKRPNVRIEGHIYDKNTKLPIETPFTVSMYKKGSLDVSSDINGFYRTKVKDRGLLVFEIHVEGYKPIKDTLNLTNCKDEEKIKKDFYLVPNPKPVFLSGTIYNAKTEAIIGMAEVKIDTKKPETFLLFSDNFYGDYQKELPDIGRYKITVSKKGFYPVTEIIEVLDGPEPIELKKDFKLSPKERAIVLTGTIYNIKTDATVVGKIEYTSPSGAKGTIQSNQQGKYKIELPEPGLYKLYTAVESYMANNDTTTVFVPFEDKTFQKDILLTPIEVGASVRLNEIYFDFNKATLRPESFPELKRVLEFMDFNKTVVVEISGHTDDRGSDEYNLDLSARRAQSVVDYLIEHGVDKSRLEAQGYGESKPSVDNDTDENRQFNRRVEFTILKV